jgi:hypothetical protein
MKLQQDPQAVKEVCMRASRWTGTLWIGLLGAVLLARSEAAFAQGIDEPTVRDSSVGYIDPALPANLLRFRYDAAFDDPRPSRAEFFYPKAGPGNPGPPLRDTSVNFQQLSADLEVKLAKPFSVFVEVPERFIQPEVNQHHIGLGDMNVGAKYAFFSDENRVATFQFRTYIPTGEGKLGLGVEHVSLEPALLLYARASERWAVEAELRDWIPIGGTDFAGNIIRYGVGVHYDLFTTERLRVVPVGEMVGWTILGGKESVVGPDGLAQIRDAAGQTIVNAKVGVRFKLDSWGDLYGGYGRALTGDRWYTQTFRIEWRLLF